MSRFERTKRYHVSENARKMEQWTNEESLREDQESFCAEIHVNEQTGEKARKRLEDGKRGGRRFSGRIRRK